MSSWKYTRSPPPIAVALHQREFTPAEGVEGMGDPKGLGGTDSDRVHLTVSSKQWIENRLEELAEIFAVAVGGFSVMDNHLHVLVRLDPDVATN